VEDGSVKGGFGSAVAEFVVQHHYSPEMVTLGVPDRFIEQGTPEQLYKECGFDTDGIYQTALKMMGR
jgi:1-deoxy-D-xylulose-5-phosphate synthase